MWLAILVVGVAFFVGHSIYISGRLGRAVRALAPGAARAVRRVRLAYLIVACSLPLSVVIYMIYAALARPDSVGLPESRAYDYLVAYPFWLVTLWSLQVSLLIIPLDLVLLGLERVARRVGWAWAAGPRAARRRHAAVLLVAAALAVYVPVRIGLDDRSLTVRSYQLSSPDLPADLDGVTVALISDLHADRHTGPARLDQLVQAVNRAHPDLVLIAGDLISGPPEYMELAGRTVGALRAPLGVWACIGDHDNFAYRDRARSRRELRQALARHGVAMLDNQVETVAVGTAHIALVFATNNYIARIDRATTAALLARARRADLQILLTHQPGRQLLADAEAGGVDLFLAGHTHGGQVRFWLPPFDVSPARLETPYITGGYRLGKMLLVVTSGLGTSVAPYRYRAPATVELIHLRRGS